VLPTPGAVRLPDTEGVRIVRSGLNYRGDRPVHVVYPNRTADEALAEIEKADLVRREAAGRRRAEAGRRRARERERQEREAARAEREEARPSGYPSRVIGFMGGGERAGFAFVRGDDHLRRGDVEKALAQYRQAVQGDLNNPHYRTAYGLTLIMRGRFGTAAGELRRALRRHRRPEQVRLPQGEAMPDQRPWREAVELMEMELEASPTDADLQFVMGFRHMVEGRRDLAARHFAAAHRLDRSDHAAARMVDIFTDGAR